MFSSNATVFDGSDTFHPPPRSYDVDYINRVVFNDSDLSSPTDKTFSEAYRIAERPNRQGHKVSNLGKAELFRSATGQSG